MKYKLLIDLGEFKVGDVFEVVGDGDCDITDKYRKEGSINKIRESYAESNDYLLEKI